MLDSRLIRSTKPYSACDFRTVLDSPPPLVTSEELSAQRSHSTISSRANDHRMIFQRRSFFDYLEVNRRAFDIAAPEFSEKVPARWQVTKELVRRFATHIDRRFLKTTALELGPGSGIAS